MIKNLTPLIKYHDMKRENHFYEMLTATVSHDLKTPLNAIMGLYQLIETLIQEAEGKK